MAGVGRDGVEKAGGGPAAWAGRRSGVTYLWIGGGCGGATGGRLFNTCIAIEIIPATSDTLAGTTRVVDFCAS